MLLDAIQTIDQLLVEWNTKGLACRNLRPGEQLPANLPHGLPADMLMPQPDWCWLLTLDGIPAALLVAAPAQNLVYLMRICAATHSPTSCLLYLLRRSFKDMLQRGYNGYLVHLDPASKEGGKLIRLARRAAKVEGISLVEANCILLGGSTNMRSW